MRHLTILFKKHTHTLLYLGLVNAIFLIQCILPPRNNAISWERSTRWSDLKVFLEKNKDNSVRTTLTYSILGSIDCIFVTVMLWKPIFVTVMVWKPRFLLSLSLIHAWMWLKEQRSIDTWQHSENSHWFPIFPVVPHNKWEHESFHLPRFSFQMHLLSFQLQSL